MNESDPLCRANLRGRCNRSISSRGLTMCARTHCWESAASLTAGNRLIIRTPISPLEVAHAEKICSSEFNDWLSCWDPLLPSWSPFSWLSQSCCRRVMALRTFLLNWVSWHDDVLMTDLEESNPADLSTATMRNQSSGWGWSDCNVGDAGLRGSWSELVYMIRIYKGLTMNMVLGWCEKLHLGEISTTKLGPNIPIQPTWSL